VVSLKENKMFKNNFVVAVKASGKVLREFDDTVYLPFGTEYSILLKNLFRKKVKVHVKIDGQDALDGKSLIIDPHDSIDLKRFIKNGNLDAGNAFKFIEKTDKIEKHRGNRAEDGLITVEYEFEANWNIGGGICNSFTKGRDIWEYDTSYPKVWCKASGHTSNYSAIVNSVNTNTSGITAPGSIQEQKFTPAGLFIGDGVKHVLTMQLKGLVKGQQEVTKPVTVTQLKRCSMCGTSVRQVAKFCHECGSSVEIV
jgi:hypothetical protein